LPDDAGGLAGAQACIREHLIPRIKLFCARGPAARPGRPPEPAAPPRPAAEAVARGRSRVEVVVVGVSTGGPNALSALLSPPPAWPTRCCRWTGWGRRSSAACGTAGRCRPTAHNEERMSLTPADFDYVRALVRQRAAIVLESDKAYLAETRLLPLARAQALG